LVQLLNRQNGVIQKVKIERSDKKITTAIKKDHALIQSEMHLFAALNLLLRSNNAVIKRLYRKNLQGVKNEKY